MRCNCKQMFERRRAILERKGFAEKNVFEKTNPT